MLLALQAATSQSPRLVGLKQEVVRDVVSRAQFTQQMVDQIFSFAELGFQETETSRYLVDLLRKNGFTVREGVAGIPTAWVATWGTGKPVISLGSAIDDIPQASQKPGVACNAPLTEGAPGHGEGPNSGQAVTITAALEGKKIRQGVRLRQRSHDVIANGGDQPNVVPSTASVWYYLRELDYPHIMELYALADTMARAAAMMTSTTLLPERVLGSAWPGHFNRVVAEAMYENIKQVGLPEWSDADQRLAKALQRDIVAPESGLAMRLDTLRPGL